MCDDGAGVMEPLALTEEGTRPEGGCLSKACSSLPLTVGFNAIIRLLPFYFPGTENPFECSSHLSLPQEHVFISCPLDLRLG